MGFEDFCGLCRRECRKYPPKTPRQSPVNDMLTIWWYSINGWWLEIGRPQFIKIAGAPRGLSLGLFKIWCPTAHLSQMGTLLTKFKSRPQIH